jgi:hypothetical protein
LHKSWGTDAEEAGMKEVNQMHWRNTFVPKRWSDLTDNEKKKVLESHMFVVKKRDNKVKSRWVAGGYAQQDYLTKEDASSTVPLRLYYSHPLLMERQCIYSNAAKG